jgi:hypothetical protein
MSRLLLRLLDIMRLRSGPQDLPAGWGLTIVLTLAYLAEGFIADQVLNESDSAPRSLVAITIQYLATSALLTFRDMGSRLPQTLTALAGTGAIFGALSIVLVMQATPGATQPALALVWFGAFLWSLAVDAHIYRRALSFTMSLGVLVAVLIFALNFIVIETVFSP